MGREIKRVALDFDWPLDKTWHGYLNPHYLKCWACEGDGCIKASRKLGEFSRRLAVLGTASYERPEGFGPGRGRPLPETQQRTSVRDDRWPFQQDPAAVLSQIIGHPLGAVHTWMVNRTAHTVPQTHVYEQTTARRTRTADGSVQLVMDGPGAGIEMATLNYPHPYILDDGICDPTTDFHEVLASIDGLEFGGGFFGSGGSYAVYRAVEKALGLPEGWDSCPRCGHLEDSDGDSGMGVDPTVFAAYDAWESFEPPEGEGWQVWETVGEGSPISPVFATPEELARHMTTTRWGADTGTSYEQWLKFIVGPGWAPSMVSTVGADGSVDIKSGVQDLRGAWLVWIDIVYFHRRHECGKGLTTWPDRETETEQK